MFRFWWFAIIGRRGTGTRVSRRSSASFASLARATGRRGFARSRMARKWFGALCWQPASDTTRGATSQVQASLGTLLSCVASANRAARRSAARSHGLAGAFLRRGLSNPFDAAWAHVFSSVRHHFGRLAGRVAVIDLDLPDPLGGGGCGLAQAALRQPMAMRARSIASRWAFGDAWIDFSISARRSANHASGISSSTIAMAPTSDHPAQRVVSSLAASHASDLPRA